MAQLIYEDSLVWLRITFLYLFYFAVIAYIWSSYRLIKYLKYTHPDLYRELYPPYPAKAFLLQPYFLPFPHEINLFLFSLSSEDFGDKQVKRYKAKIRASIIIALISIIPAFRFLF